MKKVLAIFAVLVLTASFAFAGRPTYNVNPATGTFTATVVCTPGIVGPTTAADLGNYFVSNTYAGTDITGTTTLTWYLYGPTQGTYVLSSTGPTQIDGTASTISGGWDKTMGGEGYHFTNIDCSSQSQAVPVTYTVTSLTTGGSPESAKWELTLSMTVTL